MADGKQWSASSEPSGMPSFLEAHEAKQARDEQVQEAAAHAATGQAIMQNPQVAVEVVAREIEKGNVASIEIRLPSGVICEMGPPRVAVPFQIARILDQKDMNDLTIGYTKALLYVRKLNGAPVPVPSNKIEAQQLMIEIGDENLDALVSGLATFWPSVGPDDLQVLKKNLR